jgi:predicted dehydrogenase
MPKSSKFMGRIDSFNSVEELSKELDLVIIATNSKERRGVLEKLLSQSAVKHILLEKVLFTKPEDYRKIAEIFINKQIKVWVNCSRRMMPSYKTIKNLLSKDRLINMHIWGSNWGLGSNLVHFLDTFTYLSGRRIVSLSFDLDKDNPLESKRKGYIEITGTITAKTEEGDLATISSIQTGNAPIAVQIQTGEERIFVSENQSKGYISSNNNDWDFDEFPFKVNFQSELTTIFVNQVFSTGVCDLPSFEVAKEYHLLLIEGLVKYINQKNNSQLIECLIT